MVIRISQFHDPRIFHPPNIASPKNPQMGEALMSPMSAVHPLLDAFTLNSREVLTLCPQNEEIAPERSPTITQLSRLPLSPLPH